ncbi:hypothetical protein QJS10_CPA10g01073 [Acorus calamus]|uniref:Alpha-1,3/1,6-mannosyltransferase ALG2 n=1 Tax=Acorus calamus TaxID=4465 RepID=A0AAV9DYS8_ACOCL|nr:hypothetical protein QJS10_CPA10g01073 [Acorus calamus]
MAKQEKRAGPKLKIAIIHPDLGIGGAERLIVDAAVELSNHGHDVHVFTAHHDRNRCFEETISGIYFPNLVIANPIFVHKLYITKVFFRFLFRWISSDRIRFILAPSRVPPLPCRLRVPPVPLCRSPRPPFVAPLRRRSCRSGLRRGSSLEIAEVIQVWMVYHILHKVMFYCHFPDLLLARHSTMLRRLYRMPIDMVEEKTTGMADLILVNSRFTASTFAETFRHLHSRGIEPAVLYPAVNVEQFDGPCTYKMNFLSINRFERKKNIQLAISAFAMLQSDGGGMKDLAEVSLTVVGGYDKRLTENVQYLEELKSLAEQEGVSDQVKFITSCSTAERNTLLSECMCVLYTPKDEHFGIVPLEAMAARKPVIACNSGGPVETIKHEKTGFLCNPTPHEFCQAMLKLVSDPQRAERMGSEARRHVKETFSTDIFGERLNRYVVDIYHRRIE